MITLTLTAGKLFLLGSLVEFRSTGRSRACPSIFGEDEKTRIETTIATKIKNDDDQDEDRDEDRDEDNRFGPNVLSNESRPRPPSRPDHAD